MAQAKATDYVIVKVAEVGFADEDGLEGLVLLKAPNDDSFTMRAFSGETAMHMSRFEKGDRSSIPSVYNMIEEFAEKQGLHLAGIEVFPSGNVLRAGPSVRGQGERVAPAWVSRLGRHRHSLVLRRAHHAASLFARALKLTD